MTWTPNSPVSWEATSKWDDKFIPQATQLTMLGLTELEISKVWGIELVTLHKWKNNKPGFYEALQMGRQQALGEVAQALFKSALGYEYEEDAVSSFEGQVTITRVRKYAKPNPWACAKILAIKDRANWSEVQRSETVHTNINIAKLDLSSMSAEELALFENIQKKQLTEHVGNS
jgi:hypothetical protein